MSEGLPPHLHYAPSFFSLSDTPPCCAVLCLLLMLLTQARDTLISSKDSEIDEMRTALAQLETKIEEVEWEASKVKLATDEKVGKLQSMVDERDKTIVTLTEKAESGGAASAARIAELEALVAARGGMIEALTAEVKDLRARLE